MSEDLNKVIDALKSESVSLKAIIDQLSVEKEASIEACQNLFNGNLTLSAALKTAYKREMILKNDLAVKDAKIKELSEAKPEPKKAM